MISRARSMRLRVQKKKRHNSKFTPSEGAEMSGAEDAEFYFGSNGWFESIIKNDEPRVRELMVRADFTKKVSIIDILPVFFFILVYFFFFFFYSFILFFLFFFLQLVCMERKKGNGRIDWSGERMIGLIYFILFYF